LQPAPASSGAARKEAPPKPAPAEWQPFEPSPERGVPVSRCRWTQKAPARTRRHRQAPGLTHRWALPRALLRQLGATAQHGYHLLITARLASRQGPCRAARYSAESNNTGEVALRPAHAWGRASASCTLPVCGACRDACREGVPPATEESKNLLRWTHPFTRADLAATLRTSGSRGLLSTLLSNGHRKSRSTPGTPDLEIDSKSFRVPCDEATH
jgi:hypothetical protein